MHDGSRTMNLRRASLHLHLHQLHHSPAGLVSHFHIMHGCHMSARTIDISSLPVAIQSPEPRKVLGFRARGLLGGEGRSDLVDTFEG